MTWGQGENAKVPAKLERRQMPASPGTDPVLLRLAALEAAVAQLTAHVDRLEARFRPRDAADAAVLMTIAMQIGGARFTSAGVLRLAAEDLVLADALEAADVTGTRELGALLARLDGHPVAGYRLVRVGRTHQAIVWRLLPGAGELGESVTPQDTPA